MIILPSMDLMNGACVRLKQGCFAEKTTYSLSPLDVVEQFKDSGAMGLHIVDLQGAKIGQLVQFDMIKTLVGLFGKGVQAGGGVRSRADIERLLEYGVQRVVIGTSLVTQQEDVLFWNDVFGMERLVFALDVRIQKGIPFVATCGWQSDSQKILWDLLNVMPAGSQILCTDIGQDGMQAGPNFQLYQTCVENYPQLHFQSSGGICTLNDIEQLKKIPVSAAIIGKALYEGQLQLEEVIACSNDA